MPPKNSTLILVFLWFAALGATSTAALSGPITVPGGTSHGDQFQGAVLLPIGHTSITADIVNELIVGPANTAHELSATSISWAAIASAVASEARANTTTYAEDSGLSVFVASSESFAAVNTDKSVIFMSLYLNDTQITEFEGLVEIQAYSLSDHPLGYQSAPRLPKEDVEFVDEAVLTEGAAASYDFAILGPITVESLRAHGVTSPFLLGLFELAASR